MLCYAEDSRAKLNLWKLWEIIRSAAVGYTKNVIYFCVYSGGDCCFSSSSFFWAPLAHALTITFERFRFAPPRVGWHPCSSTHIILEFVPPYFPTILKARRRRKKWVVLLCKILSSTYFWFIFRRRRRHVENFMQFKQTNTELAPKAPKIGVFRIEKAIFRCFLYQNRRRRRRKILSFFRINKRFRINKCAWLAGGMGNRGCWTQSLIPSP